MIVEWTARSLALKIKNADPERTADLDVLEYSLKILVNATLVVILTVILNCILGFKISSVLLGAFGFALLRSVSGGYHLKSSDACVIVSAAVLTFIQFISTLSLLNIITDLISIALLAIFSPRDMQVQSHIPERYNLLLKLIGLAFIVVNMWLIKSNILSSAFLLQTLTLLIKNRADEE